LAIGIILNLGILGFFKYYGFFMETLIALLSGLGIERDFHFLQVVLPVGISFFTFQGISYVMDVYRGHIRASRSLLDMMLYISFFPQLVAGPIVRAARFLPQLEQMSMLNKRLVTLGFFLIVLGLFKKTVIATYLATDIVDNVFFEPAAYSSGDLILGAYAYAMQIYCDFSAYSDIAIGAALLLGYRFHANFNQPYRARKLQEFWRRWHISLSTWLRDYLYIPLGGSRLGKFKTYRNIFVTMFLGGLWHGAAWTFVLWGGLHGLALCIERWVYGDDGGKRSLFLRGLGAFAGFLITFHFVCFTWIFFRSPDFATAWDYVGGLGDFEADAVFVTPFVVGLVALTMLGQFFSPRLGPALARQFERLPGPLLGICLGGALLVIESLAPEGVAPFIYFQF
jgi:D-alanyl-lipoteichoic acid acyltransferase DltB (MBOAT superfamily)